MLALLFAASLGTASWSLICMIISLILLFLGAFVTPTTGGPWYRNINFVAAGIFFFVLAIALGPGN